MKRLSKSSYWLFALLLTFLNYLPAQAQKVSGVMMVVKGDIKVTVGGKTEPAKVGRKVSAGDIIVSGPDSRAKIVMADKNVINVSPDSKIVIEKYENDGKDKKNVELNVVYGKVRASVEQKYDGEKSKFNIKTPSAVAGVRGTDFMAGYNPQTKVTQVVTFSGTVAVGLPGPSGTIQNAVFVQPGEMTQASPGQAPEAPKPVPPEDLNQLSTESNAETAANSSGSKEAAPTEQAAKKDEPKEEKKTEDKPQQEAKSDKKSDGRKPANEANSETKSDMKSDAKNEPKQGSSSNETKASNDRGPASPDKPRPPMPGGPNEFPVILDQPKPFQTIPDTTKNIVTPETRSFIDNVIINQKTNLTITIAPQ